MDAGVSAAAHLEGATLTQFPGVAHFPRRQVPARFAEALEQFLAARDLPNARLQGEGWVTRKLRQASAR